MKIEFHLKDFSPLGDERLQAVAVRCAQFVVEKKFKAANQLRGQCICGTWLEDWDAEVREHQRLCRIKEMVGEE